MLRKAYSLIFFHAESILTRSKMFYPLFKYINDRIFGGSRKAQVFLIKGLIGSSNSLVKTLFIGTKESAYEFADKTYSHLEAVSYLNELQQNQIDPLRLPRIEIVAARIDRPFMSRFLKQDYLVLPNVSFGLDLRMSTAALIRRMSRRRRRDLQKIKSFNYSYSISRNDERDFDFFYRQMYLPYTTKRFRKTAHIKEYLDTKAIFKGNGGILFLKKKEIAVAGILFQIKGKELYASSFGVYKGDESYIQDMASQATLFFLVEWAKKHGMESLDYGVSLPFFKGGVFTYKKEWGMAAEEQRNQSVLVLKLNFIGQGSLSFLQQNPFIVADKNKLRGIVFLDHKPLEGELKQVFSRYFLPKLDSLIVVAWSKPAGKVEKEKEPSTPSSDFGNLMKSISSICEFLQGSFDVEVSEFKE